MHLVSLTAALLVALGQADERPLVVLIEPPQANDEWARRVADRVDDELRAAAFAVRRVRGVAREPTPRRLELVRLGEKNGAQLVVRLLVDPEACTVEVWARGEDIGKLRERSIPTPDARRDASLRIIALQAVELMQAALIDIGRSAEPPPPQAPVLPAGPPAAAVEAVAMPQVVLEQDAASAITVAVGMRGSYLLGGTSPRAGPCLRATWSREWLRIGVEAGGDLLGGTWRHAPARVDVRTSTVGGSFWLVASPAADWTVPVGVVAGWTRLRADARAPSPLTAGERTLDAVTAGVVAGAELRMLRWLLLGAFARGEALLPPTKLLAGDRETIGLGPLSVGVELMAAVVFDR